MQISSGFGEQTVKKLVNSYRFVKNNVEHLQAKDLQTNTLVHLPITLQSFEEWAKEINW